MATVRLELVRSAQLDDRIEVSEAHLKPVLAHSIDVVQMGPVVLRTRPGRWVVGRVRVPLPLDRAAAIDDALEEIVGFLWVGKAKVTPTIKRPDFETLCRHVP